MTATIMISVPLSVTGFIDLDTGATVWGTLQDRLISAQAWSASLVSRTLEVDDARCWVTLESEPIDLAAAPLSG